jgi:hypothetical protein
MSNMQRNAEELAFENSLVLNVLQGTFGLISERIKGISIKVDPDGLMIYFAVSPLTAEVEEDIDQIAGDAEAFGGINGPDVRYEIYDGAADARWPGFENRMIFRAKP